jgi:hypothetical protein
LDIRIGFVHVGASADSLLARVGRCRFIGHGHSYLQGSAAHYRAVAEILGNFAKSITRET